MSDKPTVHASLSALETEGAPEPFRFALSGSKIITFPDPGAMDWLEAEEFMQEVMGKTNSVVLRKWLSEDDFEKLKAEKFNLRQINELLKLVGQHYKGIFGDVGEGDASTES